MSTTSQAPRNIVQIATPYSTGTGFFWAKEQVYVTCEHIVRDNREVVIQRADAEKELAEVLFTDPVYDVAFLKNKNATEKDGAALAQERTEGGTALKVYGFTPNTHLKKADLRLISSNFHYEGHDWILLDTEMESDYTGSPLLNEGGEIIGMNIGFFAEEDYQLALSATQLKQVWEDFKCGTGKIGTRCYNCEYVFFAGEVKKHTCPNCKDYLILPDQAKEFQPSGVSYTIEKLIENAGYQARLSRRGPNNWQITQGSARVNISYYEKNGLISADAHLCMLPEPESPEILQFLLKQNHRLESLTFSVDHQDVILSVLIHDKYLNTETGIKLFRHLLEQADYYDNILVDKFGARWYSDQRIFD